MNRFYTVFFIFFWTYMSWQVARRVAVNIEFIDYLIIAFIVLINIMFSIFILRLSRKYRASKSKLKTKVNQQE
jgi:hypothetical protein